MKPPEKRQGKILYRFLKWAVPISIGAIIFIIQFLYLQIVPLLEERESALQQEISLKTIQEIRNYSQQRKTALQAFSSQLAINDMELQNKQKYLEMILNFDPSMAGVFVVNSNGEVTKVFRSDSFQIDFKGDLINGLWALISLRGGIQEGEIFFSSQGMPYQWIVAPIIQEKRISGLIGGFFSLEPISGRLNGYRAGKSAIIYVVDQRGRLLAHSDITQRKRGISLVDRPLISELIAGEEKRAFQQESIYINQKGNKVVASTTFIKDLNWGIIVEREISEVMVPFRWYIGLMFSFILSLIFLVGVAVLYGFRWILNPVKKLKEAAAALSMGNLAHRVDIKSGDEMETLGMSFNNMAARLQESMESLAKSEAHFRALVENMGEGLLMVDKDKKITYINPAYMRLTGYSKEEMIGRESTFLTLDSESTGQAREQLTLREKGINSNYEVESVTKAGEKIPLLVSGAPILDEKGVFQGGVVIFTDMREIKKLQQEREKALRMAAIGEISAVVSHELRNALGAINNSVYFLRSQLSGVGEKVQKHINLMGQSLNSANRLINDVLDYCRPKRPSFQPILINSLIERTLAEITMPPTIRLLKELEPSNSYLFADSEMIGRVLYNLLMNALEAMSFEGTLRVMTRREDNYVEAAVEDTGSGMAPEVQANIFEPFFSTKPKGTGLGLYVSKQIVEKHGGEIMIASKLGKGSTFTVRLPLLNTIN